MVKRRARRAIAGIMSSASADAVRKPRTKRRVEAIKLLVRPVE
jgi:hypothetical protein